MPDYKQIYKKTYIIYMFFCRTFYRTVFFDQTKQSPDICSIT